MHVFVMTVFSIIHLYSIYVCCCNLCMHVLREAPSTGRVPFVVLLLLNKLNNYNALYTLFRISFRFGITLKYPMIL